MELQILEIENAREIVGGARDGQVEVIYVVCFSDTPDIEFKFIGKGKDLHLCCDSFGLDEMLAISTVFPRFKLIQDLLFPEIFGGPDAKVDPNN